MPEPPRPRVRPALLPSSRWARGALLLLIAFALLRSILWASTQPAWFAPDEDYHWLYTNYLVEEHRLPSLDRSFATKELYDGVTLTGQGTYFAGPRRVYRGDPHAVLAALARFPRSTRIPTGEPPRPVLHPPLYHLGAGLVDAALGGRVSVTRLTAMRYWSALLGAAAIFFAWLLAAQVLAREWQQLAAAALVATQPIVAFSSSTMTNDVAVLAAVAAVLAWCAFLLRSRPVPRQGIGLGVLLTAALYTKATTLGLLPLVALTLLILWRTYPQERRAVLGIAAWAGGIVLALAGWWYVRLYVVTGSALGARADLTGAPPGAHTRGLADAPDVAWQWLSDVYRSYWFDYNSFEVTRLDAWFYVPLAVGILGFVALAAYVARARGTLVRPEAPGLRQVVVLTLAPLILLAPPLGLDVLRGLRGLAFVSEQGRFLTPAYAALAVLLVVAVGGLSTRRRWVPAAATGAVVAVSFVFFWHTWVVWVLERYYGPLGGHWGRALEHASFDKPRWVTGTFLGALIVLAMACFLGGVALTVWRNRPSRAVRAGPAGSVARPHAVRG